MIRYYWDLAIADPTMKFMTLEWWSDFFKLETLSIWLPGWAIGGVATVLDLRRQRQITAILVLPLVVFMYSRGCNNWSR